MIAITAKGQSKLTMTGVTGDSMPSDMVLARTVAFRQSRWKAALRSVGSALLAWACWWGAASLTLIGEIALWVAAAMLVANVFLQAGVAIRPGVLVLSEAGIHQTAWWYRTILPWSRVDRVFRPWHRVGVYVQLRDRPFPTLFSGYTATAGEIETGMKAWLHPLATAQVFE
jgi:hypothetical protein